MFITLSCESRNPLKHIIHFSIIGFCIYITSFIWGTKLFINIINITFHRILSYCGVFAINTEGRELLRLQQKHCRWVVSFNSLEARLKNKILLGISCPWECLPSPPRVLGPFSWCVQSEAFPLWKVAVGPFGALGKGEDLPSNPDLLTAQTLLSFTFKCVELCLITWGRLDKCYCCIPPVCWVLSLSLPQVPDLQTVTNGSTFPIGWFGGEVPTSGIWSSSSTGSTWCLWALSHQVEIVWLLNLMGTSSAWVVNWWCCTEIHLSCEFSGISLNVMQKKLQPHCKLWEIVNAFDKS